ncbi:MAG TPA: pyridoxal phosphate-dependent aminotransferase, partial [Nitrososphaerales archaeon]|nr:pyridoxal phosphate-dependent aminotransferase [Nitrososphaerales archaeon]
MQLANRISSIPKSGIREIFDIASSQRGVINLGIGEPDFDTPKFIRDSAKEAIERGCHKYTTNSGMLELRNEISKKLKKENGIDLDPGSEIIVTSGATQAIFVAMHCLLNPGDEVLMPSPVFVAYMQSVKIAGGTPVEVPMKEEENYALSVKTLEKAVTKRTKLLVLNSPCNPTGTVYSRNAVEEASAFAERHGLTIVSDEIYEDFLYEDARNYSPASKPEFRDRILTINGFSKTFAMTGWRLGYAAGPEKLINAMTRYNMYNQVCATTVAQVAGIAALKGSRSFFKPILERYSSCRRIALKLLDKLGLEFAMPQGAFYIFPN